MPDENRPNSLWNVKKLKLKLFNFLRLEADQIPAWLVLTMFMMVVMGAVFVVRYYPVQTLFTTVSGIGTKAVSKFWSR